LVFSLLLPDVPVVPLWRDHRGQEKNTELSSQRLVKIAHSPTEPDMPPNRFLSLIAKET
jgi:hypothetical protein